MRYSAITGEGFYNIGLSRRELALVDAHFLAAAHHRVLASQDTDCSEFHRLLYWQHIRALFSVVHGGDFSQAKDPTGRGYEDREKWDPAHFLEVSNVTSIAAKDHLLPDPEMFHFMPDDERFGLGESHPYDLIFSGVKALITDIPAYA